MRKESGAAENSAWIVGSRILNIAIEFIVGICVTRYLGAEQKGIMADATAISGLWSAIASFGLLDIIISRFSVERSRSGVIAGTSMLMLLISGAIAFFSSIISSILLGKNYEFNLFVAVCSIKYLFSFLSVIDYWFISNSKSKNYAIVQPLIALVSLFARILGIIWKCNVFYFILINSVSAIVSLLVLVVCYKMTGCSFEGHFCVDKHLLRELFVLALPMMAQAFCISIYMKVDQIMVGQILGDAELGIYSVAVHLAELWYFIPTALYSSFLPVLTKYAKENEEQFYKKLQLFADIIMSIGYAAVLGILLFGRIGIATLYGESFSSAGDILVVYIWSGLLTCITYVGQVYFIIRNNTVFIMMMNMIGALLNFILNVILIRRFGAIGAAFATVLEYAIVVFGQMIVFWNKNWKMYLVEIKAFFPFKRVLCYLMKRERNKN